MMSTQNHTETAINNGATNATAKRAGVPVSKPIAIRLDTFQY